MIQLKKLQIPESTLDLRDFSNYSKSFSEYEKFAQFYENEINQGKKNLYEFGIKIVRENFIKDEIEWSNILNEKDFQKILELKNLELKENQIFIKCGKTNSFFNISESYFRQKKGYSEINIQEFEEALKHKRIFSFIIDNQKITLNFDYMSNYYKAPYRNRDGSYRQNNEIYEINLLDLSVNFEHKTRTVIIPSEIPHNRFG